MTMDIAIQLDRRPAEPFVPAPPLRSPILQTALTTVPWDIHDRVDRQEAPFLVDAGPDAMGRDDGHVKLLAYYDGCESEEAAKGVALLLHGWEGSSHSLYSLATARDLIRSGYNVIRLNLRDHGPGYHVHPQALNPGVFLGTLIDEAVRATICCAELSAALPFYVVGFSMGGNFALRIALHREHAAISNLAGVIAVNPAVNPSLSTARIDRNPVLRRHFRTPWVEQLVAKQRHYPELYDFDTVIRVPSLVDMTTALVRMMDLFEDAEEYFAAYSVLGRATEALETPVRVISSVDDMIVPVVDLYGLTPNPNLKLDIHPRGGHVGYLIDCPPRHAVGSLVLSAIESF